MPTRNVSLTDHWDQFVLDLVDSGEYSSASEVHREALRRLERDRKADSAKLDALRNAVEISREQYRNGHFLELTVNEIPGYVSGIRERITSLVPA